MRENDPRHRQMRKEQRKLERKRGAQAGLPSILIICEGRETEPNYLKGLCSHLQVNAAAVRIEPGGSGTDPVSLVRWAQKRFRSDGGFDLVYVVCDGDSRQLTIARTLAQKGSMKNTAGERTWVQVIASIPSIEFWLLLHFEYTAKPFGSTQEVIEALQAHLPDYQKNDLNIFDKVAAGVDMACQRCQKLRADLAASGAAVPDTDLPVLVEQLRKMQRG